MSSDGGSFMSLGVLVGGDWRVDCHTYPETTPILAVDAGRNTVTVSVKGHDISDATVKFARELAAKAQLFAAEMDRLHAAKLAKADHAEPRCAECGGAVKGMAA